MNSATTGVVTDPGSGCIRIRAAASLHGEIQVPGDKSISHRALMLASLARGESRIIGLSTGEDVQSTKGCLHRLGVAIREHDHSVIVRGNGLRGLIAPEGPLDAGNSGTTMRLLAGILAGQSFTSVIDGDASLRRRPMQRIIEPLGRMGARIEASSKGTAPLKITGGRLQAIEYVLPRASAQVKSCILLAGLFATGRTVVIEPRPTRDHTEIMMAAMGLPIEKQGERIAIEAAEPRPLDMAVPGDFSSAAFFLAAALLLEQADLKICGVGLNPTRSHLLLLLERMGATVQVSDIQTVHGERMVTLQVRPAPLQAIEVTEQDVPLIIDELPILAVLAARAQGRTVIRGASELRVKESDRIRALAVNLKRMGARVKEYPDGLEIEGPCLLRGAEIDSFGDHRIAMAFAVAGLVARGDTIIRRAGVAAVSFPEFFSILQAITRTREVR